MGISGESDGRDLFGRGGFLHPFLSLTEYYTDNVYYADKNKKDDFVTVLSPGVWLTVPHVHEKLLHMETTNVSPGGFSLSRAQPETFKRYQLYLFYNADIERFAEFSDQNAVNHRAEGFFQYNLRGGLSLEVLDQFIASHDVRGTGTTSQLDRFRSNLSNISLNYDVSYRLRLRADYSNFRVNYLAARNDFRDRDDNAVSGYLFYKLRPKTAAFVQYQLVDVRYDSDTSLDSREHHVFGGLQWDITAKSKGAVKAGYGVKDFEDPSLTSANDFILEAQVDYQFTPKTSMLLKAARRTTETNVSATDYVLSSSVSLEYLQKITGKITGDISVSYTNDKYNPDLIFNGVKKRLIDDYYTGVCALQYKFREWLETDLGYIYDRRDSSFSEFNYTNNIVFLRITGSL